ncbi:MAG: matrixin family metalloprotease, partial [Nitrososphaeraceae archaeon]
VSAIFMTLLLVATLSLTYSDYSHISASTNNDNEDFEDQNLIQICCAWGEELRDGILTYKIDDDDISKDQKAVVQDAIEEWDAKIDPLELEEVPDNSDITIEFEDGNDDSKDEVVDIAGETMTTFYGDGVIGKVEITINKNVQDYEFDTKTIGQIAKHEMGHALGLGHANFDANLMAEKVNDGTAFVSECEIKAVIEANYWMLGQNEEDADSTPDYPQENSMACD